MDSRVARFFRVALSNRWMGLVAGIWIMACAGNSYNFAIYSSALKSTLGYDQKQINGIGAAKDIGDNFGLLSGLVAEFIPMWVALVLGACQTFLGYSVLWLVASGRMPQPPFFLVALIMATATNGGTWYNTATLVTCIKRFPRSRGPAVGILKGFVGLSGAIFTQIYTATYYPDQASFLFLVATVVPLMGLLISTIFAQLEDASVSANDDLEEEKQLFRVVLGTCCFLAAFLMLAVLVQDLLEKVPGFVNVYFTVMMLLILALPLFAPLLTALERIILEVAYPLRNRPSLGRRSGPPSDDVPEEQQQQDSPLSGRGAHGGRRNPELFQSQHLLTPPCIREEEGPPQEPEQQEEMRRELCGWRRKGEGEPSPESGTSGSAEHAHPWAGSPEEAGALANEELRTDLDAGDERLDKTMYMAIGEGAVVLKKRKKGPRRGEDFYLTQALVKADFWLLFFSVLCGSGSGLTAINNLAQMAHAQGYKNVRIFVSLVSIWNFLGRLAGGSASEHYVRQSAVPRPLFLLAAQACMLVGHVLFASAWPWSLHVGSLIVGSCYGAHWALMPAIASELFGLRSFGAIYNFLAMSIPIGSFLFSGLLAGYLYDEEVARQKKRHGHGGMASSSGPNWAPGTGSRTKDSASVPGTGNIVATQLKSTSTSTPTSTPTADVSANGGRSYALFSGVSGFWQTEGDSGSRLSQQGGLGDESSRQLRSLVRGTGPTDAPACIGPRCFRLTFILMAVVCCVGMALAAVLVWRTRLVYKSLYERPEEGEQREGGEGASQQEPRDLSDCT